MAAKRLDFIGIMLCIYKKQKYEKTDDRLCRTAIRFFRLCKIRGCYTKIVKFELKIIKILMQFIF